MQYKFIAYGHQNILATHKTTLEFTKDKELTLRGDCIVGVNANFDLSKIKNFIKELKNNKIRILLAVDGKKEEISAEINRNFNSGREIVIRKSDFKDERTFAFNADKSAYDLSREMVIKAKNKRIEIKFQVLV